MDVIFHLLHYFPEEAVRDEVDQQVLRVKHPALAELHDKYCSKNEPVDRQAILKRLKSDLEVLCNQTLRNRSEGSESGADLWKLVQELRTESESRNNTDQLLEHNRHLIIRSYSEYLDLSLELLQKNWIPHKNGRDNHQSYVLHHRVFTESAMRKLQSTERALAVCPDVQHVAQRKADMVQLCERITQLNCEKRELQSRLEQLESAVDPVLMQEYRSVREDLMEKEWAAAQLQQSPPPL